MIVLSEPGVSDDVSLFDGREPFGIEDFFSEGAIKAFVVSILPRTAGIDLIPTFLSQACRPRAINSEPLSERM
mgnify:CR=1 FL=1